MRRARTGLCRLASPRIDRATRVEVVVQRCLTGRVHATVASGEAAERTAKGSAGTAPYACAQELRLCGARHDQHCGQRGARQKMIRLHGPLLWRARTVRDLSGSTTNGAGDFFRFPCAQRAGWVLDLIGPRAAERRLEAQLRPDHSVAESRIGA